MLTRYEITKSSWYETRAGVSFPMLTPPKFSSWQVNTTSRQGIKQGFLLVLFFFHFHTKVAGGRVLSNGGEIPGPRTLMTALRGVGVLPSWGSCREFRLASNPDLCDTVAVF